MTGSFDRPVGAESDVKELEYISFLHQSTPSARTDCSIRGEDVQVYLKSRYGIDVDISVVNERIMSSFGGDNNDIDLMELTSMLLIPILLKSNAADYGDLSTSSSSPVLGSYRNTDTNVSSAPGNTARVNPIESSNTIFGTTATTATVPGPERPAAATPAVQQNNKGWYNSIKEYCFPQSNIYNDDQVNDAAMAAMLAENEEYNEEQHVNDGAKAPSLEKGVLLPPPQLFEYAAQLILHDLYGDSKVNEPLTPQLVIDILNNYGEYEIATNAQLVNDMVLLATNAAKHSIKASSSNVVVNSDDVILFNGSTFAAATTYDVQKYDISAETKMTTLYDDVFPSQQTLRQRQRNNVDSAQEDGQASKSTGANISDVHGISYGKHIFTAPQVDVTAGTFRSKTLMILLWTTAIISFCIFYVRRADNQFEDTPSDSILEVKGDYCNNTYPFNVTFAAYSEPWKANTMAVTCNIGMRIRDWLVLFLIVGTFGSLFTGVGSIGNTIYVAAWWHPLLGCVPVLVMSAASLFNPPSLVYLRVLSYVALLFGMYVVSLHIAHVISIVVSDEHLREHPGIRDRLSEDTIEYLRRRFRSRQIEAELLGKKAIAYKLNLLIRNSIRLFKTAESKESIIDTYYGRAIHAFSKDGIYTTDKNVGSLFWTWKSMYNKKLYSTEGIRFSVRIMAANIGQIVICFFVIWAGYQLLKDIDQNYGEKESLKAYANLIVAEQLGAANNFTNNALMANVTSLTNSFVTNLTGTEASGEFDCASIDPNDRFELCKIDGETKVRTCQNSNQIQAYCNIEASQSLTIEDQILALNEAGYDVSALDKLSQTQMELTVNQLVESYYPAQKYMVRWPVIVGVVIAFFTACSLTVYYLSSTTATILQLRCGKIDALRSRDADRYRAAQDTVALLSGSIFWGCLVSSAVTGAVWGFIVFLFVWQVTVFYAQRVFALLIGLLSITLLRLVLLLFYRASFYGGFYRLNPFACNIGVLILEWANFTLSAGVIIIRMVKLLVIAGFSIGRVYRPFLAQGIGNLGPIELDGYFTIYLRELLAHEAHRHPYIELLGYVYLMKLKYSNEFATQAGSIWRLLFVHALFPWLQRYRLEANRPTATYTNTLSVAQIRRIQYRGPQIGSTAVDPSNNDEQQDQQQPQQSNRSTRNAQSNLQRALNELPPREAVVRV